MPVSVGVESLVRFLKGRRWRPTARTSVVVTRLLPQRPRWRRYPSWIYRWAAGVCGAPAGLLAAAGSVLVAAGAVAAAVTRRRPARFTA